MCELDRASNFAINVYQGALTQGQVYGVVCELDRASNFVINVNQGALTQGQVYGVVCEWVGQSFQFCIKCKPRSPNLGNCNKEATS